MNQKVNILKKVEEKKLPLVDVWSAHFLQSVELDNTTYKIDNSTYKILNEY